MTLENLLDKGMGYKATTELAEAFSKDTSNYGLVQQYVGSIYARRFGLSEDNLKQVIEDMKKSSPASVKENMDLMAGQYKSELTDVVAASYQDLVKSQDKGILSAMAWGVSGKQKQIEALGKAIKEDKMEDAKKMYASTFKEKAWIHYVLNHASSNFVKKFAGEYVQRQENDFMKQFALDKPSADGKSELDPKKIADYLLSKEAEAKDEKAKKSLYFDAGMGIVDLQLKLQMMAQEAKKAEEAKKSKDKPKK